MKIAIIDADLLGRTKHRFPNLVCEKLSAYWKEHGAEVELKLDYENLDEYDKVYISKVFTDTWVPEWISENVNMETGEANLPENIFIGGTGFFFEKAPNLDDEIEHHMPDYHLYDEWIASEVARAEAEHERIGKHFNRSSFMVQFKEYTDYSIGFVTRGCFRKCPFCVNQKYDRVFLHSPLEEFYDPSRKKICLLDDNVLGCPEWKSILEELITIKKPFKFKQGMDERILTEEKCELLFSASYDGDYTFAFDNIEDYEVIHKKLKLIEKEDHEDAMQANLQKLGKYKQSLEDIDKRIKELENEYRQLESEAKIDEELKKCRDFAMEAMSIIVSIETEMASDVKSRMEHETMSIFDELIWKKNTYSHVELDHNFRFQLFNNDGKSCFGTCSAAEKELLALAFTIALHKVSGYNNLLFIDTPVGRVSDINRSNFASVLKEISRNKQIILAFTPSEYSDEIKAVMNDTVVSSFNYLTSDEASTERS